MIIGTGLWQIMHALKQQDGATCERAVCWESGNTVSWLRSNHLCHWHLHPIEESHSFSLQEGNSCSLYMQPFLAATKWAHNKSTQQENTTPEHSWPVPPEQCSAIGLKDQRLGALHFPQERETKHRLHVGKDKHPCAVRTPSHSTLTYLFFQSWPCMASSVSSSKLIPGFWSFMICILWYTFPS